jgi:DNA adenine methylase
LTEPSTIPPAPPPVLYYGSKARIAERIVPLLPAHEHYVEPYAGSLAVLLAKQVSPMETVNDLSTKLMTFWRVVRDRPEELDAVCALTPHSRAEHVASFAPAEDELETARRVWVMLTQGQSARLRGATGWRYAVEPKVGSIAARLEKYRDRLPPAAARLMRVSLECRPALDVITEYGKHPKALLYVDPPYPLEVRDGTNYEHEMSDDDHRAMAERLHAARAAVVLSGYACALYDQELFADWHRFEIDATTTQGKRAKRIEVVWSNRPLPTGEEDVSEDAALFAMASD